MQPPSPSQPNKAKRKSKREAAVQRALAAWDDEYIGSEQEKCPEVGPIRSWLIYNIKPDWNNVRGKALPPKLITSSIIHSILEEAFYTGGWKKKKQKVN